MNLNKFTKAELISKFKKLENKNSNNNSNQSLFSKILAFISYFKGLIFKFTIISIIIKTFKKYSLFNKIFRFINWIILTIFGISLIDNFPFDFTKEIRYILSGIITYFSNTHFYTFIASLFSTKEDVTIQKVSLRDRPLIEGFSDETTRNEIKSKRNSKISEWLKPEPEIKEDESNNTKYYVMGAMLILACLSWYYWDEIRTVTPAITNYFRRPRPGNDGIGNDNTGMNNGLNQPSLNNRPAIEDRLKNLVSSNNSDPSQIELQDNTQNIASSSNIKLEDTPSSSSSSMSHYFNNPDAIDAEPIKAQLTGLKPITGQDFTGESTAVVNEIETFLNYHDNASFPKAVIGAGFYKVIRDRLAKLADLRNNSYEQLIQDNEINNKIERFLDLENQFYTQPNTPQNEPNTPINEPNTDANESSNLDNNNLDNQNTFDAQSDTYEQVAVTNIESRMAWSDRATPSVHSQQLSPDRVNTPVNEVANLDIQPNIIEQSVKPKSNISNLLDSIRARRDDSHVVGSPSSKISNLVDNSNNLNDTDLLNAVKETFNEDIGLKLDTTNSDVKNSPVNLPKIDIDSNNSSDSSMNHYFNNPDVTQNESQSRFTNLFDSIRARRDDSNVLGSPNIGQIGLQPSRLSPLNTKPSISNLFDDTTALFDDDDDLPISNIDKGKAKEVDENLLSNVINDWDKVETNIQYGESPSDIIVNLKYDNLWTRINSYRFVMNNGQVIDYPYKFEGDVANKTRTFNLASSIETDNNSIVELKEIIILDLNHRGNSVWKNSKYSN